MKTSTCRTPRQIFTSYAVANSLNLKNSLFPLFMLMGFGKKSAQNHSKSLSMCPEIHSLATQS